MKNQQNHTAVLVPGKLGYNTQDMILYRQK